MLYIIQFQTLQSVNYVSDVVISLLHFYTSGREIYKLKYTLEKGPLHRDIISESPQVVSIMTFNQQNQMVLKWSLDTLSNREWQAKKIK